MRERVKEYDRIEMGKAEVVQERSSTQETEESTDGKDVWEELAQFHGEQGGFSRYVIP